MFPRDNEELSKLYTLVEKVSGTIHLPFRHELWRGTVGNWLGSGIGSSIDFQDHRQYVPGDDPRYINWQAYARTGHYSMKLYREEVSPVIDLVVDVSHSMELTDAKARRVLEVFYFCATCALQSSATLRCYAIDGKKITQVGNDTIRSASWLPERESGATKNGREHPEKNPEAPWFRLVPWRPQALRIIVSDLCFPGAPADVLPAGHVRGIIFAVNCRDEVDPEWLGNVDLRDVETSRRRLRNFNHTALKRYRDSYRGHFQMWEDHCRQYGLKFCRVGSERNLLDELSGEALHAGAVEILD